MTDLEIVQEAFALLGALKDRAGDPRTAVLIMLTALRTLFQHSPPHAREELVEAFEFAAAEMRGHMAKQAAP